VLTFLIGLCFSIAQTPNETQRPQQAGNAERGRYADVVRRCEALSPVELHAFLGKLACQKDYQRLAAIYASDFPLHEWAAGEAARVMESDRVVEFCRKFEVGSANWQAAFYSLHYQPKRKVIPYVKEMAKSRYPEIRYLCYRMCIVERWEELLQEAIKDKHNHHLLGLPNIGDDEATLGQVATKYIRLFGARPDQRKTD
jgi:hypothetical protein